MTKRIMAFMLVLAMLVSVIPISAVTAEVSDPTATKHTHSDTHACSEQCSGGTVTWTAWEESDKLPTESGHYYLTGDVQLTAAVDVAAGKDITICLNGYNIRSKSNSRIGFVYGKLTVSDCTAYTDDAGNYICGSVVGSTAADGAVYGVRREGTLVLESGRITGGKTTGTAGGGAIFLQKGTTAGRGGYMYMYGGEISGNEGNHGGGVCLGGADSGCIYSAFFMYGGTITGNTARGNGGGIYAENRSVVEFHGGSVTGNTAAGNGQAVNIAGQWTKVSATGKVVVDGMHFVADTNAGLKVSGLAEGTEIDMTTAATDMASIVSLASGGKQESWNTHWVTANGESVSMVDGAFVLGHYHGTTKYEAWTGGTSHNTLPTGGKNYYLANDILRNTNGGTIEIPANVTQHMCLNGFTITHRNPANRLYNIKGIFFLEDCTAYTDSEGNYISGGVTYDGADMTRTYGNAFSVQRGSTMTMTGGQIYGFHSALAASQDSVPVYVQGAQTTAKAVFNMQGGQIHSNTTKANGAAIRLTKASSNAATENFSEVNISGGRIWGNTTTTNGGAIAMTGDVLNITGGVIEDNTAAVGAVYATGGVQLSISGSPVIKNNQGGNLYLAGTATMNLGALDAAAEIGVGAAQAGRAISNEQTADPTAHFTSDDSEVKVSFKNNCVYLGSTHEHGIDGGAGDMGWSKWTSKNTLPTESGNYYLENDIQLTAAASMAANQEINICLNGKTVTAKSGARIMAVSQGSTLTVTDCCESCGTVTGGTNNYGGAFNVLRGGTLKLYNGKITGNTGGEEGGAVYVQSEKDGVAGGIFYMYGGVIDSNTAKRGGAVALAGAGAQFYMYGGTIENNTATTGGAVFSYANGSVTLAGGKIVNNTATGAGGGLFVPKDMGMLRVMGSPVVTGNKAGQQANNIYLQGDMGITAAGLTEGAQLCISAEKAERVITNTLTQTEAGYFYSDSAYRIIEYQGDKLYLSISGEHTHCACAVMTPGCDHLQVKWQAWESTTTLPTASGYYYLLSDVNLATRCTVPANQDVHLCLNGKTVTAPENNRLILVQGTGELSITDCIGTGKLTGGNNTFGGAININRRATVNLYGGTITGNKSETSEGLGGAVYIQAGKTGEAGGIFNMYGGKISGNTAYAGGGLYVAAGEAADATPAQLNIYGGEISGNSAGFTTQDAEGQTVTKGGNGGAFFAGRYSQVRMTGGTITGNTGLAYGGNIYLNGATGTFSGGLITKNVSQKDGGGLYAVNASTVEITGDIVISDNQVPSGAGGGIGFSGKSLVTMSGGTVSGNYAVQGGGAIVQSGASMILTGGTFSGNESKAYAGAIYVNQPNADGTLSTLYMQGGTITGNTSGNAAGGVYVNKGYMEMTGGTISKNETANYGCGIYFMRATGKVTGGTVTGNVSGKDGAGIYCYAGQVEIGGNVKITNNTSLKGAGGGLGFTKESKGKLTGGTITGNSAGNAGGIIVQGQAHLTMTGGYVGYNTTKGSGGGVYVNKSSMDLYGGQIVGNTSVKTGAGMFANNSTTNFGGTYFANNEATANGGAFYINKGTANINGGTYENNTTLRYGGGLYFNGATVTMKNAKVIGNSATIGSGGMHAYGGKITMENCLFSENTTDSAGGGVSVTKFCELVMTDCVAEKNEANNGGGVLLQNWATATLNDVIIRDNVASSGAGLQVYSNVEVTMNGGEVTGNLAKTKLNKAGDTVGGIAAGVYMNTSTKTQSGQSKLYLNDVMIENNIAERTGGGVYVDMQMLLYMDGCTVQNNQAGGNGAGIYQATGTGLTVENSKILANTGTATGSAIYAGSDFTLENSTITGNKTTDGAAVYVAPARYDGHSYTNATVKFGGDLQISDNEGTQSDLYMDEGTAAGVTAEGFGKNTEIHVQLHSGVLTNTILGAYDYEGGDQLYTVTYGDRSLTDPEYVAPAQQEQTDEAQNEAETGGNTWLYVGVGVIALAVIAVIIALLTKKKKAETPAKADKE